MIQKTDGTADISRLEKRAQKIRLQVAGDLAGSIQNDAVAEKGHSHFSLYEDKLPLLSGVSAIQFNKLVTDIALRDYVLHEKDPFIIAFLGGKVVEQTFTQIFDPARPHGSLKNLSVAKHYGVFFTPPDIAKKMISSLSKDEHKDTLIDPCLGSGVLLAAALMFSKTNNYRKLVGVELDSDIAGWAKSLLDRIAQLTGYDGEIVVRKGNGLAFILDSLKSDLFSSSDIIVNPPYGRLRITKDRATNAETALTEKKKDKKSSIAELNFSVKADAELIRNQYAEMLGERGILEYSRIFFRSCAEAVLKGAEVSIISPDSWMSGREGERLRRFVIENRLINKIQLFKEESGKFATVNQATSITHLNAKEKQAFRIIGSAAVHEEGGGMEYDKLIEISRVDLAIPRVSGHLLATFERLSVLKKFGNAEWIINARGEIDQTAQKALFSERKTTVPLVRGEHVDRFFCKHSSSSQKPSFLLTTQFEDFIKSKPKRKHYESDRIVGRQCSYAQQPRRLMFCRVSALHAVGNSCNYITVLGADDNERKHRTYLLLGLLNSAVFDWYFRIENSNNHVGNYEIDNFPLPSESRWEGLIAALAYQIESTAQSSRGANLPDWMTDLLEAVVGLSFGLSVDDELQKIIGEIGGCDESRVINFARHLQRSVKVPSLEIGEAYFNHGTPTLSELDRLIISYVPEGGNWQSIPESVPSERIKQIREMSAKRGVVRTTYYGRLRRDQPAYTINTYFNRPGNGTHIHPVLDRTLTSREAARLQSFPDSYVFLGSDGAVRDQIGNAVPPLLSAAIGRKFIRYAKSKTCVDVFCGAGGLSLGLESAGWEVIAAVDNNREALDTYCFNRPCILEPGVFQENQTAVFKRDLQERREFENVVMRIEASLKGRQLDLLVGGPPCQGFSHAGFRLSDDKRNDLASIYLHFAECLRPRIFILENVEGLATFNKGQVLRDICFTLRDLGYRVNSPVWKLCSEQYGAPQMRRRVFIVATTEDAVDLSPPEPIYERCAGRRENRHGASLCDAGLPAPFTVSDALGGLSLPEMKSGKLYEWLVSGVAF
ncbi:Alw26I/Eco31I/Esp3I family type II restriction adenine-specific DNA-methyltransferase [Castellaniella hirudinis]|uniref:Alw26I/Eco31I/Esp3I family type II restriction adenine-specific DNA-methyltransferase n=1 Tax=Castellaniella hirudinis TaxID=1144617 RepID=UPI0039C08B34